MQEASNQGYHTIAYSIRMEPSDETDFLQHARSMGLQGLALAGRSLLVLSGNQDLADDGETRDAL